MVTMDVCIFILHNSLTHNGFDIFGLGVQFAIWYVCFELMASSHGWMPAADGKIMLTPGHSVGYLSLNRILDTL